MSTGFCIYLWFVESSREGELRLAFLEDFPFIYYFSFMKLFLVIASLTLLASCTLGSEKTPVIQDDKTTKQESVKLDNKMMSGTANPDTQVKLTGYVDYTEGSVKTALAAGQKVVLFFHASWCPSCKSLNAAIMSELASIPADTLIVKVDYDSSDVLKQKYGVTSQHTTVLIDKDMRLISKKLGARSVSEVLN